MGDNYPRGIHLFAFSKTTRKRSKVVYTFKTRHCTDGSCHGRNPPVYEEISSPQQTFYQASNDNEVYTEIAHRAAIEVDDDALLVLFSSEGPSLDNSLAVLNHNAP